MFKAEFFNAGPINIARDINSKQPLKNISPYLNNHLFTALFQIIFSDFCLNCITLQEIKEKKYIQNYTYVQILN